MEYCCRISFCALAEMSSSEKFSLKWNEFESNISQGLKEIREEKDFLDVTLVCDDENFIEAHKVILSACSPFFRNILRRNSHQHPLLYLKGVKYRELLAVLNFMYMGEVSVAQEELNVFLSVAEDLRVKGLTQNNKIPPDPPAKTKQVVRMSNTVLATPSATPIKKQQRNNALPKNTPTVAYNTEEQEIEDYGHVKTEPGDVMPEVMPIESESSRGQISSQQFQDQLEEAVEQGTVALPDEQLHVDEQYRYDDSYIKETYTDQLNTTVQVDNSRGKSSTGNAILSEGQIVGRKTKCQREKAKPKAVVKEKPKIPISRVGKGSNAWQCDLCSKIFSLRYTALEHLEDVHQ